MTRTIADACAWAVIVMVAITFVVVVCRYFFNLGWVWLQEIVLYLHAATFLLASAHALATDGHVRVDVLYRKWPSARKARVDALGALFFCLPTCGLILYTSFPYVVDSWRVLEGSKDGGGLEAVFLLKTLIPLFAVLVAGEAIGILRRCSREWRAGDA